MRKRTLPEVDVLWYATQPLTPTYRAIVRVFADAERDTFTLELAEPEVLQALRASPYEAEVDGEASLRVRLDELHQHGNLNRRQDERAISLEDLDRRRFLWSLTPGARSPTKRSRTSSRAWVYPDRCRSPCWSPSETAYVP
jgi:hypothetical protein